MRGVLQKNEVSGGALVGDNEQCAPFQVCGKHASFLKESTQILDGSFARIANTVVSRARVIQCVISVIGLFFFGLTNVYADSAKLTNPDNGHSYQRFDTPLTWSQAKDSCASQNGHLATIASQAENEWVWSNLVADSDIVWLGGSDAVTEGQWKWVTGETWSYSAWHAGEPNSSGNEDGLCMWTNGYGNSDWNDCYDAPYPYVCEWEGANRMRAVVTTLSTPTTPVIIGDQFIVNFTVSGATSVDTTYEKVFIDLLREDDQLLYPCREFTDIPVLAGSSWSNHATCQIPADKLPGKYKVVLSAKKAGQFTFYLPTEGAANNPLEITANKSQPVEWDWLTVSGTVEDNQTNPVAGASVVLCPESSNDCRQTTTDNQGDFQVQYNRTSASPDDWKLTASIPCASGSGKDSIDIHLWNGNYTNTYHQNLQVQCNDGVKLPVIVVPGVFGSTLATSTDNCAGSSSGCYPAMGETYRLNSEQYKILSPDFLSSAVISDIVGSKALTAALQSAGYPVIALPWDWRIPTDEAAGRYLKKMIDKVKADYNVDKVHVVAHSQGGLLARAYIQGLAKMSVQENSDVVYGNDIAKLVMLGTPNGGAANPYWMLEGGEPLELDNLAKAWKDREVVAFYSSTTNNLYKMRNKKDAIGFWGVDDYKIERSALVNFYHTEAPGARSLMAQNNLLTCTEDCSASSEGNAGQFNNGVGPYLWLHENLNVTNLSNLGKLWETNKVQTHLILSNNVETIDTIKTKNNTSYNPVGLSWSDYKAVYKYGIPKQIQRVSGDGTVSVARARKPLEDVVTISTVAAGEHASLMKTLAPCVVATLDNGTICSDSMVKSMVQAKTTTLPKQDGVGVVSSLHLTVNGMPQPQLVDPAARATGINATGTVEENIPDTQLLLLGENSAITVSNPASGDYILNLRGQVASEYTVMITYIDSTGHLVELSLNGVHDAGEVTSIPFTLNPTVTDMVKITPVIGTPSGFLAASSNGNVLLSWNVVSGASGYRIYSKRADMAEFSLLGTTTATQYQTDIPWDENGTGTQWFFYVVALTADGHIGTFDKSVDNRSLVSIPANFIKTFPWPMFLPAITHGVKHP